jgi:hypothetical protein
MGHEQGDQVGSLAYYNRTTNRPNGSLSAVRTEIGMFCCFRSCIARIQPKKFVFRWRYDVCRNAYSRRARQTGDTRIQALQQIRRLRQMRKHAHQTRTWSLFCSRNESYLIRTPKRCQEPFLDVWHHFSAFLVCFWLFSDNHGLPSAETPSRISINPIETLER